MSFFSDQALDDGTQGMNLQQINQRFWGTIENISEVPDTVYNENPNAPKVPKTDSQGRPLTQLRVLVAGQPDGWASVGPKARAKIPADAVDDGRRAIYIGRNTNLSFATAAALQEAGGPALLDRGLEVGGQVAVTYTHDVPTNKGNPAKGHLVQYKPPAQSSGAFFNGQQPQQAPQQPQAPQYAAPPQQAQAPQFAAPPQQPQQPAAPQYAAPPQQPQQPAAPQQPAWQPPQGVPPQGQYAAPQQPQGVPPQASNEPPF